MLRKFKLIKEYPRSPKLGHVIQFSYINDYVCTRSWDGVTLIYIKEIINYKEYWEEIIEKDYEILTYKGNLLTNQGYFKKCFGGYTYVTLEGVELWKNKNISPVESIDSFCGSIYSIKRLSDNSIFTINDISNAGIITEFELRDNKIFCKTTGAGCWLEYIQLQKEPVLFTTDDNVELLCGAKLYIVNEDFTITYFRVFKPVKIRDGDKRPYYSSREKALEYIDLNKPKYNKKQIYEFLRYVQAKNYMWCDIFKEFDKLK